MSKQYCEYLVDLLVPLGEVSTKSMFGGHGIYTHGKIFAIVIEDILYFKTDAQNRPDYEAAGSEPFSYETKKGNRAVMSYWQVPADIIDDSEMLLAWAEKSYQVAIRSEGKKRK